MVVHLTHDAHHFQTVLVSLGPQAVGVDGLVAQGDGIERSVEVADGSVDVDGLHRIAGQEMHRVQRLTEPQQILIVGPVAHPTTAIHVEHVGGTGHRTERHVVAADGQVVGGVGGMESEMRWCGGDALHHHPRREADPFTAALSFSTRLGEHPASFGVEKVHADGFQNAQRGEVDGFQFIDRYHFGGGVFELRLRPRTLFDDFHPARFTATSTTSAWLSWVVGHGVILGSARCM